MNLIKIYNTDIESGNGIIENGIIERTETRIQHRNMLNKKYGNKPLTKKEKRNILIGEIGEIAVRKDLLSRGFKVIQDSWSDFKNFKGFESPSDITVSDGRRTVSYQVKSSEAGNRSITFGALNKYVIARIDYLCFVAVRPVSFGGDVVFEAAITSQMRPSQILRLSTWTRTMSGYSHVDNKSFIDSWCNNKLCNFE